MLLYQLKEHMRRMNLDWEEPDDFEVFPVFPVLDLEYDEFHVNDDESDVDMEED
ncbi:MAG: hypothetical protein H7836_16485 [Magnetococcus sp. YQC-3]